MSETQANRSVSLGSRAVGRKAATSRRAFVKTGAAIAVAVSAGFAIIATLPEAMKASSAGQPSPLVALRQDGLNTITVEVIYTIDGERVERPALEDEPLVIAECGGEDACGFAAQAELHNSVARIDTWYGGHEYVLSPSLATVDDVEGRTWTIADTGVRISPDQSCTLEYRLDGAEGSTAEEAGQEPSSASEYEQEGQHGR